MEQKEDKLIDTQSKVIETFEFKGVLFTKTTETKKKADEDYPEVTVSYRRETSARYNENETTDSLETMHARISRVASDLAKRQRDFEKALTGAFDRLEPSTDYEISDKPNRLKRGEHLSFIYKGLLSVDVRYDHGQDPLAMIYSFERLTQTKGYSRLQSETVVGHDAALASMDAYLEELAKLIKEAN